MQKRVRGKIQYLPCHLLIYNNILITVQYETPIFAPADIAQSWCKTIDCSVEANLQ